MPIVNVERPLRERLGEEATEALIRLLNQLQHEQRDDVLKIVEEKFERRLSEELAKVRGEMAELGASLRELIAETASRQREELTETAAALRKEIAEAVATLREEATERHASLRQEIVESNASLRAEMRELNAQTRAELIKWMFIFWAGQLVAILGILLAFFRR